MSDRGRGLHPVGHARSWHRCTRQPPPTRLPTSHHHPSGHPPVRQRRPTRSYLDMRQHGVGCAASDMNGGIAGGVVTRPTHPPILDTPPAHESPRPAFRAGVFAGAMNVPPFRDRGTQPRNRPSLRPLRAPEGATAFPARSSRRRPRPSCSGCRSERPVSGPRPPTEVANLRVGRALTERPPLAGAGTAWTIR